jgi:hypothetical protein
MMQLWVRRARALRALAPYNRSICGEPCLPLQFAEPSVVVITTLVAVPGPLFTAVGRKPPSSIPARRAQPRHSAGQSGSEALKPRPAAVCQLLF